MEFRVLGPLEVLDREKPIAVTAPRQRALLAVLLIHANEVVSTDRLLDLAWGDDQPDVGALRYQVSKLRESLQPRPGRDSDDLIVTQPPGYVLRIGPGQLDAVDFEALADEARQLVATDPARALGLLDEALSLWHGPAFGDFAYEEFARFEILRLEERRLQAIEDRFDALLALSREREAIADLRNLVAEHPRRERLVGALMLALYRSGRQADALDVFRDLRQELGELGLEPSQDLVKLEERVLLQDESLLRGDVAPTAGFLRGYVLRGQIGAGAQGVVWRAAQPGVGREVAIKAIRPELSNRPEFVRRFEAEAQLIAALEHPNIVSLFDFWRDPNGAYLVMPYLRGGDLTGVLQQGPLEPSVVVNLIAAVGSALDYAHARGVVHRDVTPHNILFDDDAHPYLADFGMAGLLGDDGPPVTSSPAYVSPEQAAGQKAVVQSDVFSLGVLIHTALTGRVPGAGERLPPICDLRHDIPPAVDEVVACATAHDCERRYATVGEFVDALGRSLGMRTRPQIAPVEQRNPYKGLRAFEEADSADFFGRESLVTELVQALARHRLVGVVGPSGCGKSSLVRAGAIPALRRGALPGSERWLITDMYPGSQPFAELRAALLRVSVDVPGDLKERLAGSHADRGALVDALLPAGSELLLVIDQFEELFTLTGSEDIRREFLAAIADLVGSPMQRVRVVVTLRADFFGRPLDYPEFGELLRSGLVSIASPGREGLIRAVVGPAGQVGVEVESGLVERIADDVIDQPGGLPLLEYALTESFQRRVDRELTVAGYEQTGGVLGALGRRAEDLYAAYDEVARHAAQQVFLRLVTVEEGSADTRRRILLAELHGMGLDEDALHAVLDDFGSYRLLTFDRDPESRAPTVEVAHEALLSRWERLRTWIDDRRDDLVLYRRLATSLAEWHESGEQPGYLLGGGRLEHYEVFAGESDLELTDDERGFLAQSRAHADRAVAQRRRRRRAILAGFAMATLIAVVFAVAALLSQRQAEDLAAEAQASEQLAEQRKEEADQNAADAREKELIAENEGTRARASALAAYAAQVLDEDPDLSLRLLIESIDTAEPTMETIAALHETILAHRLIMERPDPFEDSGVLSPNGDIVFASGDEYYAAISVPSRDLIWQQDQNPAALVGQGYFSPDGGTFLALPEPADDASVPPDLAGIHVFDVATGERTIRQVDSPYPVSRLIPNSLGQIDPELPIIAVAGKEMTDDDPTDTVILRLDLSDGSTEPVKFLDWGALSHGQWTTDRAVTRMALGVSLQTAVLDLETGEITRFGPPSEYTSSEAISPDGDLVVTVGRVRNDVWDLTAGGLLWPIPGNPGYGIAFSSDGGRLVTGNQVWDARTGELLLEIPSDTWDLSISADGKTVMVGGKVWNAGPNGEAGAIDLPTGGIYWEGVELVGDRGVALNNTQAVAYVYELTTTAGSIWGEVMFGIDAFGAPALSADGRLLAVQQEPMENHFGRIGIYDAGTGELLRTLEGLCDTNNDTLVAQPGCRPYPESPFSGVVWDMVWLPDGQSLAASVGVFPDYDDDRVLIVWDVASGEISFQGGVYPGFIDPILDPTGKWLVGIAPGQERSLILNTQTWQPIAVIDAWPVRFAPDGSLLAKTYDEASDEWVLVFLEGGTWLELGRTRIGEECLVWDAQFSSDGVTMAANCWSSGVIVIVDVAGGEMIEVPAADRPIKGIKFIGDSQLIAIPEGGPGIILETDTEKLIELARDRVSRDFTEEECIDYKVQRCMPEE